MERQLFQYRQEGRQRLINRLKEYPEYLNTDFSQMHTNDIRALVDKLPKIESKAYIVTYTKRAGGDNTVIVKAPSPEQALKNAAASVYTGKDFRDAKLYDGEYIKPREQGFFGSNRQAT
jgi:hypothetical protein